MTRRPLTKETTQRPTRWFDGPLAAFDTETTGADVERDRVVSAALVTQRAPDRPTAARCWLVDPGRPIPAQATAAHGITDAQVRSRGRAPGTALHDLARALAGTARTGTPLVVTNAPSDLTLMDRELRRHRGASLAAYTAGAPLLILDPRVLDQHLDRSRHGRRTLADLCAHYGVPLEGAHDAAADATASLLLVREIGRRFAERVGELNAAELHLRQAIWHAGQARGPEAWFSRSGSPERAGPAWPLRTDLPEAA
jgi:DNA polymerase-3 subunit epsilon